MLRKNQADFWVLDKIHRPTPACASRQGQLESLGTKHKTNMRRLWKAERRQTGWGRQDPRKDNCGSPGSSLASYPRQGAAEAGDPEMPTGTQRRPQKSWSPAKGQERHSLAGQKSFPQELLDSNQTPQTKLWSQPAPQQRPRGNPCRAVTRSLSPHQGQVREGRVGRLDSHPHLAALRPPYMREAYGSIPTKH